MQSFKRKIRNFLIILFYLSGATKLQKVYLNFFYGGLCRILCFHWIGKKSSANFEKQLIWLKKNYEIISLIDLLHKKNKRTLVGNEIAITFDDGFSDFYDVVLPLITKLKIPVTLFIPSKILEIDQKDLLKFAKTKIGIKKDLLNKNQIKEINRSGIVNLQSHSHNHCDFGVETLKIIKKELLLSKNMIQKITGNKVDILAYPYGDIFNTSDRALHALKEANFNFAATIVPGFNHSYSKDYELKRDSLDPNMNTLLLRAWLEGGYDFLKTFINWGRIYVKKFWN